MFDKLMLLMQFEVSEQRGIARRDLAHLLGSVPGLCAPCARASGRGHQATPWVECLECMFPAQGEHITDGFAQHGPLFVELQGRRGIRGQGESKVLPIDEQGEQRWPVRVRTFADKSIDA